MAKTFYALLDLGDLSSDDSGAAATNIKPPVDKPLVDDDLEKQFKGKGHGAVGLHYHIQIHLPATKDLEVYNAIFKSLKDHLLE